MKKLLLLTLLLTPTTPLLLADALAVVNPSFEQGSTPINYGYGTASQLVPGTTPNGGTLPGWTIVNTTPGNYIGAYNPDLGYPNWTTTWEDGNNIGYAQALGTANALHPAATNAGLSQVLGDVLTANTTYTLQALVGRRLFTLPWNYSVELWAGGTQLGSAFTYAAMTADSWNLETLNVAIGSTHAALGQNLEIRLMTNGNNTEAFFDNVSLNRVTATPEPATYGMLAAGAGLLWLRKRHRGK